MKRYRDIGLLALSMVCAVAAAGCTDLGTFAGTWMGGVVPSAEVRVGVPETSSAVLNVTRVERTRLEGTIGLEGETVTLRPVARAGNDALGAMELPEAPLRSFFLVAPLRAGDALAVISLYADDRVDVRLIRSDNLYAVYHLTR